MNSILPVAVVVVYVLLLTCVALRARAAKQFEDFSLARRQLPLALVFGSLAATYVGPGFSIGFVGRGFRSGLLFWLIGLAYALQNILVGIFVAPKLRELKGCHTLGDAIGQKYNRQCQVLAGVISVGLCAAFSAVMAKAGGDVLQDMFGLPPWSSVVVVVGITVLYTTFGGLRASVITDAFQFSTFAILVPLILFVILLHRFSGTETLAKEAYTATREGFNATSPMEIVGLLAAFFLGEMLIPPYANRALASKTTRVSRYGFVLAGIFSAIWFLVVIALGISARGIIPDSTSGDYVLLGLVKTVMPTYGYALLLAVLVSVVMSSLDSLLNAGAVAFTQDIIKPFTQVTNGTALMIGRCATIAIAASAAAAALAVRDIISGLLICYTIWAPAILPALIIGLWVKKPRPLAGIASMVVGTTIAILLKFIVPVLVQKQLLHPDFKKFPAIIPALAAALLAYALGHLISKELERRKECRL